MLFRGTGFMPLEDFPSALGKISKINFHTVHTGGSLTHRRGMSVWQPWGSVGTPPARIDGGQSGKPVRARVGTRGPSWPLGACPCGGCGSWPGPGRFPPRSVPTCPFSKWPRLRCTHFTLADFLTLSPPTLRLMFHQD